MSDIKSAVDRVVDPVMSMLVTGSDMMNNRPDFKLTGRQDQLKKLYNALLRRNSNSVLMYGDSGVGLSTIALGLQGCKEDLATPHDIVNKRFMWLYADTLMASGNGKKIIEDFEKVLRRVREDENTVLVIEDFAGFLKSASKNGASSIVNAMMRDIKAKKFQAVIEVRKTELGSVLKDYHSDLSENFTRVEIEEPNAAVTTEIVQDSKAAFETHGIVVSDDAVREAIALTNKYPKIPGLDRAQPQRALQLIDQAMSEFRNEADSKPQGLAALDEQLGQIGRGLGGGDAGIYAGWTAEKLAAEKANVEAMRANVVEEWEARQREIRTLTALRSESRKVRDENQALYDNAKAEMAARHAKAGSKDDISLGDLNVETEETQEMLLFIDGAKKDIAGYTAQIDKIADKLDEGLALTAREVRGTFSRLSGIPTDDLTEDDTARLATMETEIGKRVYGQDYAIRQLAKTVRIAKAGLKDPEKPIGSFMFNGPTGVGKTGVVKALAEFLYKDEFAITRIDMSEYMEKVAVNKLIGAPPGYAGYEEGGALTNAVRGRPNQIILFDEIDKAHPDVFNVLLQVMDAGRLTDGQGVTVDFRETMIIMTSNLGAHFFQDPNLSYAQAQAMMMDLVKESFKPEFINRLDEIIGFNRLDTDIIKQVVRKEFNKVSKYVRDKGIEVEIGDESISKIADNHYEPAYGGRGIVRWLKMNAKDKLAEEILALPKGDRARLHTTYNDNAKALEVLRETIAPPLAAHGGGAPAAAMLRIA